MTKGTEFTREEREALLAWVLDDGIESVVSAVKVHKDTIARWLTGTNRPTPAIAHAVRERLNRRGASKAKRS